jgi:hypothetical protein
MEVLDFNLDVFLFRKGLFSLFGEMMNSFDLQVSA